MNDADTSISKKVAVYGANGHTGRLVVSELLKRGVSPIAVARSSEAISATQFPGEVTRRCATVDDPLSLDTAFEGASAVINCAGAFLDTANAIAGAAVRKRLHYLDVTAEQASVQETFETFDSSAREAGVVVLPAMGFFGGFADLLATVATRGGQRRWHQRNDRPRQLASDTGNAFDRRAQHRAAIGGGKRGSRSRAIAARRR